MRGAVFLFFCGFLATVLSAKLPSTFKRCAWASAEFDVCLANAIEDALGQLKNGNKDIGVVPMEPLEIEQLGINQPDKKGAVRINLQFTDLKLYGLTKTKIIKVKSTRNSTHFNFVVDTITPDLRFNADYETTGQILLLPITGKGPCTINFTNMKATHKMIGKFYEKKGKQYINYESFTVKFEPEKIHYNLENLFGGNKELGDNMNQVLNDNPLAFYNDLSLFLEDGFGLIFQRLTNSMFGRVATKDIYIY